MTFHLFTEQWKWSYGQYTHYGIRVQPKTTNNDKFEKRSLSLKNSSLDLKAVFSQQVNKVDEIDNSQMRCKFYTRYKSNADEQIG